MLRTRSLLLAAPLALGALVSSALAPSHASACGGLFCSSPSLPINQAAERIVFSTDADGSVTAIIEIKYQGTANEFAWVLPVAGDPTIGVSSTQVLDRLQQATNPQYQLTTRVEGTCRDRGGPSFGGGADAGFAAADAGAADAGMSSVHVVDSGSVGPYDYVVIHVDAMVSPLSKVAFDWLQSNGYYVQTTGSDLYEPYLEAGLNLVAFRLTRGAEVGSIRPITIGFGRGQASIPIRPTAVAAEDDMGVLVWVLGASRAVPVNYASLELDEALINWLNPSSTYAAVVTQAANESGGQGFVTEMAGAAAPLATTIWQDYEEQRWQAARTDTTTDDGSFLQNTLYTVYGLDGVRDAFAAHVPLPAGVTLDELLACINCYYPPGMAIAGFDRAAFVSAIETSAVAPMRAGAALFTTHHEVTRLFTTMSPAEMTIDPSFDFNADLPDVSNVHSATRVIECSPSISQFEAPWHVELANGHVVRGTGTSWPFSPGDGSGLPANERVLRVGTTGMGAVITDNGATIASHLDTHNVTVPPPPTSSGICSVGVGSGRANAGLVMVLGALALHLASRSRRRRA
jgi:hypothetical protein